MVCREYGAEQRDTILLLHGGGLSWWSCREAAEQLQREYRVILPILDGHAGSDRPFTTIEDNAAALLDWIDRELGGTLKLVAGLSLGGQVVLEMLTQRPNLCRYALIESAMVLPSRLTHALIAPTFGCSYGLIRNKGFSRLQFRSLHLKPALFDEYYRDTCRIARSDLIAFLRASTAYALKDAIAACGAEVHIFVGGKESAAMQRSAERIRSAVQNCTVTSLPGWRHGEFSINHADVYADAVRRILAD